PAALGWQREDGRSGDALPGVGAVPRAQTRRSLRRTLRPLRVSRHLRGLARSSVGGYRRSAGGGSPLSVRAGDAALARTELALSARRPRVAMQPLGFMFL